MIKKIFNKIKQFFYGFFIGLVITAGVLYALSVVLVYSAVVIILGLVMIAIFNTFFK